MVFNATLNNISVISWRSVLLVEETGGPGKNHRYLEMVKFGVKVSLIEPGRYGGATSAASPEMVDIFTVYYRIWRSRHGRDRMVVGFTTTYAISVYLHTDVVSSNPAHGEVYNIMS
jgi:hypothetical protein